MIGSRDAARPWFVTYVKDYPGPPGAKLKRDTTLSERKADPEPARPAFISYHKPAYTDAGAEKRSAEPEAEARPPVYIDYTIDAYHPPDEGLKRREAKPDAEAVPPVVLNYDWMAYEPRDAGA